MSSFRRMIVYAALLALTGGALGGCGDSSSSSSPVVQPPVENTSGTFFSVQDTSGAPVVGATVFAIPAADLEAISAVAISRDATNSGNYSVEALTVDEPLEDLINGNFAGSGVATYKKGVTDEAGKAEIADLPTSAADKFFIYVQPAAEDAGRLPGGSLCREAVSGASLTDLVTNVTVSTKPSATATFVGTSACLVCHPEQAGVKNTMHRNGFMAPGAPSPLQDLSRFDADDAEYDLGKALDKYTAGDATSGGTTIYFYDFDSTRKFDKFKTLESLPASGTMYATVRIYQDTTDDKYYAQFTNVINPSDPNSGMTHEVVLTYGGGIYKQRPITVIDDSMFMIPLQFNARGDDASTDRVRKIWRDYHLDWWWNAADNTFKAKPAANVSVDVQCASCHFNGFTLTEKTGGYYQATGALDPNGETHPVLGTNQELNLGCETCHGPGSEHVAAGGASKAIVSLQNVTPERELMVCGQCHSRPQGNGTFKNDSPLDATNKMMLAGTSRADFLANNVSRQDSAAGDMWGDGLHSKSHHQQYTDFIQTAKYRNGAKLLTCASCHDLHDAGTDRHQLSGGNSLCTNCHTAVEIGAHQTAVIPSHTGTYASKCIDCHATKMSTSGAGINPTTPKEGASGTKYYHGDISSHLFGVPRKGEISTTNPMPIPFTNTCGLCHAMTGL